jgi:S-DNA-T family DNA segregation ATPase FtsK/SpoIIIE
VAGITATDKTDVDRLLAAVDYYAAEVARQRNRLRTAWRTASEPVERSQAAVRAVDTALNRRQAALNDIITSSTFKPDTSRTYEEVPPAVVASWLEPLADGSWRIRLDVEQQFDDDERVARSSFAEFRKRAFGLRLYRAGVEHLGVIAARLDRLRELRAMLEQSLASAVAERSGSAAAERSAAEAALAAASSMAAEALSQLPAPLQPWDSVAWAQWPAQPAVLGLGQVYMGRLIPLEDGDLGDNASFGSTARLPYFLPLRDNLEVLYEAGDRDQALSLARSLLLRQLAVASPGDLRFCFFDPVGLGQSVADFLSLAEYDADLIGGKVWSSQADLTVRLTELTSHIELVIQKYLRTSYQTIDDFNAAAGEIAEPYRCLVLFDFPTAFSDVDVARLKSIMSNGPRCGVRTILLTSRSATPGYGVDPAQIAGDARQIALGADFTREHLGYLMRMRLASESVSAAASAGAASVIDTVGRRSVSKAETAVTFEKAFALFAQVAGRGLRTELPEAAAETSADDEATWWRGDSTRGLFAPIGQKGARDAAILSFDSADHAGTLLVGRPGSGKSTLLHTLIGGLATLYSPGELELYLIDFKEGVEFKAYAEEALPQARMVAIESDREFGLSVLQSLEAEMSRRGELLRATGGRHAGLQPLREATGEPLPRILLVFDEFQVLFARNDKLGITAAGLLETIIRQGRGFGVHVLLGSQSLAGLDALGSHVLQLLPTRILLPAAEADAHRVLGEGNDAGRYLTTHGEGILNAAGGAVEANERFKGALLPEPDRIARIRRLRAKADAAGFMRRPTVFEGNASVPLDTAEPAAFRAMFAQAYPAAGRLRTAPVRLRAGVPMTTAVGADIELRREEGGNVLAIVRDDMTTDQPAGGPAYGLLTACVAAASCSPAQIDVIDFMPVDDGLDEVLDPLLAAGRIILRRRRGFAAVIEELRKEVRSRIEDDDLFRPARLAFLFGIHRSRELDADIGSLDADPELAEAMEEVMRNGPEVGVHTWIWADSVNGAARRLSSRMMRECNWRVAGKMSVDDSLSLLGSDRAAEIRDRQIIVCNDDRGVLTRAMSFRPPTPFWLARLLEEEGFNA